MKTSEYLDCVLEKAHEGNISSNNDKNIKIEIGDVKIEKDSTHLLSSTLDDSYSPDVECN